jgi:formate dehydrogenase major subunit
MSGIDGHSTSAPLARRGAASSAEPNLGPGDGPGAPVERVRFTLDDQPLEAHPGETILQVAERAGVRIPHLCYTAGMREDGNCRACVVEIEGERVLAPSCCRRPSPGMNVKSRSERARFSQRLVVELLLADTPVTPHSSTSELTEWADELGVEPGRFPGRTQPAPDFSHPGIEVRLDACIQCTRCVRACREVQVNDVIGYAGRGAHAKIVFDLDDPMGESTCVGCGECVQACPTGALLSAILPLSRGRGSNGTRRPTPPQAFKPEPPFSAPAASAAEASPAHASHADSTVSPVPAPSTGNGTSAGAHPASGVKPPAGWTPAESKVASLCPYCGVGCQTMYHLRGERIVRVSGRDGPSNHGRLCVKGRFGFDYVYHPQRLTKPLIRREGVVKDALRMVDPADPLTAFREASWDEALDYAADRLRAIRDEHHGGALAGFGSAKGSNEEAYLFQKLVRTAFRTNNVDHCTRLCHASSVAALMEGLNSGAVSNPVADVQHASVIFIIGANPTVNHPVAATFMKNALEAGTQLILADPRRTELARLATHTLQFKPDTDVALLNAMMHTIIEEGLTDERFIAERTTGFEALQRVVQAYSPEAMEHVCGVSAATIRAAARLYAASPRSMIFWGMGISQHVHGTDNSRCLIALALMTGQIGRRGTGLHPLRGQNNVQGASDMGLIPMFYPDYQHVEDDAVRESFAQLWGAAGLDRRKGLTVVEIMNAAKRRRIRGMYIMGENPAMSDPDVQHAREALAALDFLVVQDLFLTETASFADVVLPASAFPEKTGTFTNTDRRVQLGRQALDLPGDTRQDLWIIQQLARRLGLDWAYDGPADVWAEIRKAVPSCAGITWERLEQEHAVTYPCREEGDPGAEVIFIDRFPTADGLARFVPAEFRHGDEPPDEEYPHVLITGRLLEHWHTGSMTRRAGVLDALEPVPTASLRREELERLGVREGEMVTLETRRGSVGFLARLDDGIPKGAVFVPFCFVEAAANVLTNPALDPVGKIPEFKFCAVRITAGGAPLESPGYGIAASL